MLALKSSLLRRTFAVCIAIAAAALSSGAFAQYTCSFPAVAPNGSFTISCSNGTTTTPPPSGSTSGGNFALTGPGTMTAGSVGNVTVTRSGGTTGSYNVSLTPNSFCSGGGTITFGDNSSAANGGGNIVGITALTVGTCTVTMGLSAPSGTTPTTAATTSGSPLNITVTAAGTTTPPPSSSNCPALPSGYVDISPAPTTSGPATTVRLASGVIGGFQLPTTNAGHNSGTMNVTENTVGPNSGITIEVSINKCKGVIDTTTSSCYLRSNISNYNTVTWAGKNPGGYAGAYLDTIGFCPAFEAQGPWYMNVRYTYSSCAYGTCGETFTWYDSYY